MNTDEIRDKLDQALASPIGIRIVFATELSAKQWRMNAYAYRRREAAILKTLYMPGEPFYGRTQYDDLLIRILPPSTLVIERRLPTPDATLLEPSPDQA